MFYTIRIDSICMRRKEESFVWFSEAIVKLIIGELGWSVLCLCWVGKGTLL